MIRNQYDGTLTYAANWYQEVDDVTFWDQLDYIGIQAYYPLVQEERPEVDRITKGWSAHLKGIQQLSKKYKKPILFTEIGYKSTPDAAIEPWIWPDHFEKEIEPCHDTQANCYEAFFDTFWDKDWFAGVHFWEYKIHKGDRRSQGLSLIHI